MSEFGSICNTGWKKDDGVFESMFANLVCNSRRVLVVTKRIRLKLTFDFWSDLRFSKVIANHCVHDVSVRLSPLFHYVFIGSLPTALDSPRPTVLLQLIVCMKLSLSLAYVAWMGHCLKGRCETYLGGVGCL